MLRNRHAHSLKSSPLARIADGDLGAVVGGMFGQPTGARSTASTGPIQRPLIIPPLPSLPQQPTYRMTMPTQPSPFSVSTFSTGGTGQSPQHVVSASFDNGRVFANATTFVPSVPSIPPMPSITGGFTPALQTHQVNAGIRFRF